MRGIYCVVAIVALTAVITVEAKPTLVRPKVAALSSTNPDLSGTYFYHDRDRHVPDLPATLKCTGNCGTDHAAYTAWLKGTPVVFGALTINSKYVGWGSGPSPQILNACKQNPFTVILEQDDAAANTNIFACYWPCNQYPGGSSIYTKNANGFLDTLKRNFMNDVTIWTQNPAAITGSYTMSDRSVHSESYHTTIKCTNGCTTKTPTYTGTTTEGSFTVTFAPDGYVGFGTFAVTKGGKTCGNTRFVLLTPPKGTSAGTAFYAAAEPLASCGYAGQAFRLTTN